MEREYGATIVVPNPANANKPFEYHTYRTWGLILTNSQPIGDPEQETNYLNVPGRNGLLDYSDALTGAPVYKGRHIDMEFSTVREPAEWDYTISAIRNLIEGKQVKIIFDHDPSHYWLGRINLKNPDRIKRLGSFTLHAYVDAYCYDKAGSADEMLWDDIVWETTVFREIGDKGTLDVVDSEAVVIPAGTMETVPVFTVSDMISENFTVKRTPSSKTYTLLSGRNRFPDLKVCGSRDITLTFTGTAKVKVDYRGGSL